MNFKEKDVFKNDSTYIKTFESDTILNSKHIVSLLKKYEDDSTKLYQCYVDTFTEEGNMWSPCYESSEELDKVISLPNPSMQFHAFYIDPNTEKYKFEIFVDNNSKVVDYQVDQEAADIINREIERNKMLDEEKKNREVNTDSNNKQY